MGGTWELTEAYDHFGNEYEEYKQPHYESYYERRARIAQAQDEAETAFFSHNFDLGWMRLAYIPTEYRSEWLMCCWCKDMATHYQMRPGKALFCTPCAHKLRRYRYKHTPQRIKDKRKARREAE